MSETEAPLRRPISTVPADSAARQPERTVLSGSWTRLEPVRPDDHAADLFSLSQASPELWEFMGFGPFADLSDMTGWLAGTAASDDPLSFVVHDEPGRAAGMASFMRVAAAHGVIEIGSIWFAPSLQRTRAASEALYLMMRHVFDDLGFRRLEWKCNAANAASRRAARRLGFAFEGVFYRHMIVKGRNRDTAWYAMLDDDWPAIRAAFEAWLAPENFDAAGNQIARLEIAPR